MVAKRVPKDGSGTEKSSNNTGQAEYLKALLDSMSEGVMVIDKDFRVTDVNRSAMEMSDMKEKDIIGQNCHMVSHKSEKRCQPPYDICPVEGVFRTGEPQKALHRHFKNDGSEVYVEIIATPLKDPSGKIRKAIEVSRDITERVKSEESLAFLASIIDTSYDTIVSLDNDGAFSSWNKGAEELLGFSEEEMIGKPHGYIVPDDLKHTCVDLLLTASEQGFIRNVTSERLRKDGTRLPVEMTISSIKGKDGEQIGYSYIMRDITERKRLDDFKQLFLDIMSHDLSSPLSTISILAQDILEEDGLNEIIREALETISSSARKSIDLIEDVKFFLKVDKKKGLDLEELNLCEILVEVVEDLKHLAREEDMVIDYISKRRVMVIASPMLRNVFLNLISNAIKYAREGKKILIETTDLGEFVQVKVTDFGPGIPDRLKLSIFNRFERQMKEGVKGTGLGLHIVKKIMEMHNGGIWVEDNPLGGSVFVVEIPKGGGY